MKKIICVIKDLNFSSFSVYYFESGCIKVLKARGCYYSDEIKEFLKSCKMETLPSRCIIKFIPELFNKNVKVFIRENISDLDDSYCSLNTIKENDIIYKFSIKSKKYFEEFAKQYNLAIEMEVVA